MRWNIAAGGYNYWHFSDVQTWNRGAGASRSEMPEGNNETCAPTNTLTSRPHLSAFATRVSSRLLFTIEPKRDAAPTIHIHDIVAIIDISSFHHAQSI